MMQEHKQPARRTQDNNPVRKLIIYTSFGRVNMSVREWKNRSEMLQEGFRAAGMYSSNDGNLFPVTAEFRPLTGIERRYLDDNPTWQNLAYCFYGNDGKLIDIKIENIHFITFPPKKNRKNATTATGLRKESAGNAKPSE